MKVYDQGIQIVPANTTYTDFRSGNQIPLKFLKLCGLSQAEDMQALDLAQIRHEHVFGMAAVGTHSTRGGFLKDVLAYAGITGFKDVDGTKLAIVEGVVTLPQARGIGLAHQTLTSLIEVASAEAAVTEHEHSGFMATSNPQAEGLFKDLGFVPAGQSGDKQMFVKNN